MVSKKKITEEITQTSIKDEDIRIPQPIINKRNLKTIGNLEVTVVDGEPLDLLRYYKIRESTARMLNELKAVHPDVNVCMNTIVDTALRHYYNYIFYENGEFQ